MAIVLGVAAGVAIVAWLVLLAVLAAATQPRTPQPMPAGLEFGGGEPPAVVNLITSGWRIEPEAMAATLVDLAARKIVSFEQSAPGQVAVGVEGSTVTGLASYERHVLDHVRKIAHGGTAPLAALNEGGGGDHGWWKRFEKAVLAQARADGLSRGRWTLALTTALTATALIPGVLAGVAAVVASDPEPDDVFGVFAVAAVIVWAGLIAVYKTTGEERDTDAGLAAAGRWLGLRENLAANPMFATLPPTGVALWDRYLAYAAAMGLATNTVRMIPLGEQESARRAWSAVGGEWRLVTVRYPDLVPPLWGASPGRAIRLGLALAAAIGLVLFGFARVGASTLVDFFAGGGVEQSARRIVTAVIGLIATYALLLIGLGASDVAQRRIVEGRVVRVRTRTDKNRRPVSHHVAVDAGTGDNVRAWKLRVLAPGVRQGAWVRAVVTPRLGFVRSLAAMSPPDG